MTYKNSKEVSIGKRIQNLGILFLLLSGILFSIPSCHAQVQIPEEESWAQKDHITKEDIHRALDPEGWEQEYRLECFKSEAKYAKHMEIQQEKGQKMILGSSTIATGLGILCILNPIGAVSLTVGTIVGVGMLFTGIYVMEDGILTIDDSGFHEDDWERIKGDHQHD